MPTYQYRDEFTGCVVELTRAVAERDAVRAGLRRIPVPAALGVQGTSSAPQDPESAAVQVPRAYRDLERSMGARQIVRESGFSVEQVKRVWKMSALALGLWLGLAGAGAADINKGYSFQAGEQGITHAKLNNLVDQATIDASFFTGKTATTGPGANDLLLSYNVSAGAFRKVTLDNLVFAHTNLVKNRVEETLLATNDLLLLWDTSAGAHRKATLDSLALGMATNYDLLAAPSGDDTLLLYNAASVALRRIYRTNLFYDWSSALRGSLGLAGLTPHTAPVTGDRLWIWDGTNNLNKAVTLTNLLVGGYTNKATPTTNDLLTIYDADAGAMKQTTLAAVKTLVAPAPAYVKVSFTNTVPAAGGTVSNAHGLAGVPTIIRTSLLCVTNEFGYSAGDEVNLDNVNEATSNYIGFMTTWNSSNVVVTRGPTYGTYLLDKTNGAARVITDARWKIKTDCVYFP